MPTPPYNIVGDPNYLLPFTWSTSEQIWPFERDELGNDLYCKFVDLGTFLGTAGTKPVAHGITGLDYLFARTRVMSKNTSSNYWFEITSYPDQQLRYQCSLTNVEIVQTTGFGTYTGKAFLVYSKV